MKLRTKAITALTMLACAAGYVSAQETRTLTLIEDYDQKYMCTRVFELKHINAQDLTPFLIGAVKRYNTQSDVQRLVYKKGKTSFVVVSTGVDMMPYVVDMVAKMDRPCGKKDAEGSIVDGDGIYRFVYNPQFRASEVMKSTLIDTESDGTSYFDAATNMFYWKDSLSDGETYLKFLKALDRPVPQASLKLNVYEINENDFIELGVDYISWKNGPGANLLGLGYDYTNFTSVSSSSAYNVTDIVAKNLSGSSVLGFMVAPQFDATFLRLLAQKGKAKIASSGYLTLVNDSAADPGDNAFSTAKYRLKFTPSYQIVQKDKDMNISAGASAEEFNFYLRRPTMGFDEKAEKTAYIQFGWVLSMTNVVEESNLGAAATNSQTLRSWHTLEAGTEKLLCTFTKIQKVNQNNGMPYLQDIPVLKYLAGATEDSKVRSRLFVTVEATPVLPETSLAPWAGKIISAVEMADAAEKTEAKK